MISLYSYIIVIFIWCLCSYIYLSIIMFCRSILQHMQLSCGCIGGFSSMNKTGHDPPGLCDFVAGGGGTWTKICHHQINTINFTKDSTCYLELLLCPTKDVKVVGLPVCHLSTNEVNNCRSRNEKSVLARSHIPVALMAWYHHSSLVETSLFKFVSFFQLLTIFYQPTILHNQ
jgi:hypothetical protein